MRTKNGSRVSVATGIRVPGALALAAIESTLKELSQHAGSASLVLASQDLQVPLKATIGVPIETHVCSGCSRHDWEIEIQAASNPSLYPTFAGVLTLVPAGAVASELHLEGEYFVPFGELGRTIDSTLLRGSARSSLQRLVQHIATDVAGRARWAQLV